MKKILYILRNNDFVLVPIYDDPALEKFSSKSEILSKLQVSFARVEGLTHLLDARLRVLTETALELSLHVLCDLVVEVGRGAAVALLVQVLQDRIIYILL